MGAGARQAHIPPKQCLDGATGLCLSLKAAPIVTGCTRWVLTCLMKASATPGIVVVVGVAMGMVVGAYLGHITLGAFLGAGIGFLAGLALFTRMRKNAAKDT